MAITVTLNGPFIRFFLSLTIRSSSPSCTSRTVILNISFKRDTVYEMELKDLISDKFCLPVCQFVAGLNWFVKVSVHPNYSIGEMRGLKSLY